MPKELLSQFRFPADYNRAVSSAVLDSVALVRLTFDIEPDFFADDRTLGFALASKPAVHHNEKSGVANAVFHWRVEADRRGKHVLVVDANFMVHLSGLTGVSHGAVSAFAEKFGAFATFPYFRALVSQLSWASGANLPILPVFKEPERQPEDGPAGGQPPAARRKVGKKPTRRK